MIVNKQKPIEFLNECGATLRTLELESAILWWSKKPVSRLKKVFMHGRYPAVAIHKEKLHVHRLLMSYWLGRRLRRQEYVHHRNGNKLDARRENLEVMAESEHQSLHNKGRKFTADHRRKISDANRGRVGIRQKKRVSIPLLDLAEKIKSGWSINRLAKHYGCDWSTVKIRIIQNPELLKS